MSDLLDLAEAEITRIMAADDPMAAARAESVGSYPDALMAAFGYVVGHASDLIGGIDDEMMTADQWRDAWDSSAPEDVESRHLIEALCAPVLSLLTRAGLLDVAAVERLRNHAPTTEETTST